LYYLLPADRNISRLLRNDVFMPPSFRNRSFSFYLLFFIIVLITITVVGITIGDIVVVNENSDEQAALLRNEIEQHIVVSVKTVDEGLKLFDNSLNLRMEQGFVTFHQAYKDAGGDPSRMNLEELKQKLGGEMELYIINDSGVVEYTTFPPDFGLDFNETIPYFYEYLMKIKDSDGFYPDRVVQESATGQLKKYAYMPTYDHRYVLELGLKAEAFKSERNTLRYADVIQAVKARSPYIKDLRIFTTAKRLVGNKSFVPDRDLDAVLQACLDNRSSVQFSDPVRGTTTKYLFVDLTDEDYAADMSLIVEITYDDLLLAEARQKLIGFHFLVMVMGLMIGTVAAYGVSRYFTRPLSQISNDVDLIAQGNLDHAISPTFGKEFERLEVSITAMVRSLKDMITQLQTSERHLRVSEEQYRGVVESQSEFITRFRPDGTVTFANEAYCRYFKLNCGDIIGKKFIPTLPDEERTMVREHFSRISRDNRELAIEHRIILPDGEIRWHQWRDRGIFSPDGNLIEFQSVGRDVTEQKQYEEENARLHEDLEERVRSRTAELEAAYRELDSFSYSVSHDLRAPLRAIDGFSTILIREHAPSLTPETVTYLEKIQVNTRKMGALIDDLLNFSRTSRQPLNRFLVDPAEIADEAFDELRMEAAGRKIRFDIKEMPICSADPMLLNQVYVNLLSNALKFTREREVAVIEVGSVTDGGQTTYYVKDNGMGFDMKYAGKIFGVFQKVHEDPSKEGTGVGLAIVERIIHRHGGKVRVTSVPNEGTTFFFTLGEVHP
jgi:PAS domain S-box-containing protein